jgi:hypothetical protein
MTDTSTTALGGEWQPEFTYDLFNGDALGFAGTVIKFKKWAKEQPRRPLDLNTGWHDLVGQIIEDMLIRNANNRDTKYATVLQYATALVNRRWMKTGQPIILTDQGDLEDGQHRLLAAYFTNSVLPIFVVTGVPHNKDLFAYIDNIQPRTGEDALKIAGLNGLSKHVAAVIRDIAIRYDEGMLCYVGRMALNPVTNVDILDYARAHPDLVNAAHTVKDLYPAAAKRISDPKVATFVGWKIMALAGPGALEDYMGAMTGDLPPQHPVAVFRKRLDEHEAAKLAPRSSVKKKQFLGMPKILALAIRAYNLMQSGTSVRRLDPRADDPFPRFEEPDPAEVGFGAAAQ